MNEPRVPIVDGPNGPAIAASISSAAGHLGQHPRGPSLLARRPEIVPLTATVLAWVLLTIVSPLTAWTSLSGTGHPDPGAAHSDHGSAFTLVGMVTAMTVTMMGPLAIPGIRTVAFTSLWWRAGRASVWFFAAFIAAWTVIAAGVQTVAAMVGGVLQSPSTAAGILVLLCALTQLAPRRTDRSEACDRPMRLRSKGSDANVDCARFGLLTAGRGVRLCGLPMLAMLALPASLLVTALLTTFSVADRVTQGRRRWAIAALYTALGAVLLI